MKRMPNIGKKNVGVDVVGNIAQYYGGVLFFQEKLLCLGGFRLSSFKLITFVLAWSSRKQWTTPLKKILNLRGYELPSIKVELFFGPFFLFDKVNFK